MYYQHKPKPQNSLKGLHIHVVFIKYLCGIHAIYFILFDTKSSFICLLKNNIVNDGPIT